MTYSGPSIRFLFLAIISILSSCGALPRASHDDQDAPTISKTAMTGIVIQSTDSSYTSTAIYFYDLALGKISLVTGGESGDTYTKWLNNKMYLFNRADGKISYSAFLPRSGVSSRSTERATPGTTKYDPVAAQIGPNGELILAVNSGGAVVFANESDTSVIAKITGADTESPTQPFRPADIWVDGGNVFFTHQALDSSFKANGAGKIFNAVKGTNTWALKTPTGVSLTISNPVYVAAKTDRTAIIAGVCYTGSPCVSGVDQFDASTGIVSHLSTWDRTKWTPNGGFYGDLSDETLLACVIETSTQKKKLARYTIADGTMTSLFEISGPGCGGVIADRLSQRIFIGQTINGSTGSITIVDQNGAIQSSATMTTGISGMTASFD